MKYQSKTITAFQINKGNLPMIESMTNDYELDILVSKYDGENIVITDGEETARTGDYLVETSKGLGRLSKQAFEAIFEEATD